MPENGYQNRIISSAIILGVASLASRIVGLVRERVLTTTFGAGDTFDAFVAAFRIPDFIFNLVVVGALSAAFIPLFTEKLVNSKSGKSEANTFAISVLNLVIVIVASFSALYAVLAPHIVPLITPGFSGEKLALTISLSRIMAIQPILFGISFVFSGVLNSYKRFLAYAAAPILYNVGIIIGVVVLVPLLGNTGLGWGVVIGALLPMLVQLPGVLQAGLRWRPIMSWNSADVQKLRRMIIPRVFGLAAQQVNLFIVTILGSSLATGTIAVFHLANNVQSVPIGIFGLAFAQAAFPTLAEQVARKEESAFRRTLTRSFRYILFFVIPTAVLFFLLRAQTIRVLFGAGAFDWEDTILTFRTFGWLIASLFAQSTIPLLVRAFYVRHDTKTPVIISLISIAVNISLALWLTPRCDLPLWPGSLGQFPCGVEALAVAFSFSAIVNLVLLLGTLHWQLDGFNDREVLMSLLKITIAALVAGFVAQLIKYPIAQIVDVQRTFIGVFTQLVVAGGGGLVTYIGMCLVLKCDELKVIRRFVPRRWRLLPGTETTRFSGLSD
ncbi:MAG: murein biosynthesis integral membrane protein MurJ [Candidatus Andersenbacteria bacterium]